MKSFPFFTLLVLLVLVSIMGSAQSIKNYTAEWKKVDDLIKQKNLPKSALEEVKKIYDLAKKEGQDAQVIKALVYMSSLQQETREESQKSAILELEQEIKEAKEPALSILQSLLADKYWQFFQNHRWQLYNRTTTVNFQKDDIATWSAEDLHQRISALYLSSLKNKSLLQRTGLEGYEAIIIKGNVRQLRPTLYDLLAHRALKYFSNDERDIRKPSYAFQINQPEAFASANIFAQTRFATKDTTALQYKALLIYQELIRFHLSDAEPAALIDADINRLVFVHRTATIEYKDSLYKQALEQLVDKWKSHPESQQASYLLALHYHQSGMGYQPLRDTTNRYAFMKAISILEKVVRDSSRKTSAWSHSYNLLKEIKKPVFSFELEKVNVPDQPFRSLVHYKNISVLNFRLIKADSALKQALQQFRGDKKFWNTLAQSNAIRSWKQALPATNDYQSHAVEIKVDALPIGEYVLLASTEEAFDQNNSRLGAQAFYVSGISYITQGNQFFILNRETGQPLANAAIQVNSQEYDYRTAKYSTKKIGSYQSDKNGQFSFNDKRTDRAYSLDITHKGDRLNLNDQHYYGYHDNEPRETAPAKHIFYFTDRALYRPGQIVYSKGILVERSGGTSRIVSGFKTTIFLRNANEELVDSLQVTTNEFGSFNGRFQLPQNVLNGHFYISDKNGWSSVSFSVEEYKRPKFYVNFEPVKETYKAGDSITLTGSAIAYAGNKIDNAKVSYRVVRQPRFLYPWLTWRWWLPPAAPMEIAHGEVVTDREGKFNIHFKAIPDAKIDRKLDPIFDYRIYTDITDINGETRSGEHLVSAGYKSLLLKVQMPEKAVIDSFKSITVRTENMNGVFQSAPVTLTITSLIPEARLIRSRYWQQPDQFVMTKEEYIKYFPHDEYHNESNYQSWTRGSTISTQSGNTDEKGQWNIQSANLKPGFYVMEFITRDKEGQEVKDVRYLELFDTKNNQLSTPAYLWSHSNHIPVEPGESTPVYIGTAASDVFLIQEIDRTRESKKVNSLSILSLNREKKKIDFATTEADRGGYGIQYVFVKHNRVHQWHHLVQVPWSNKDLTISHSTFRDKILPGSEEKWTVTLSGYKGEKIATEVLASMYDASLDQFKKHDWQKPGIWPLYQKRMAWSGIQNFTKQVSQQKWITEQNQKAVDKRYDEFFFNYHDFVLNMHSRSARGEVLEERVMASAAAPAVPVTTDARVQTSDQSANGQEVALTGKVAGVGMADNQEPVKTITNLQVRKNFNETAFFFPELRTDPSGNISFSFTAPESLTQWKLQTLAHTKDLAFGLSQKEIVTQKELMVQPNMPRFLRQGDRIELSAKVVNLTSKEFTGQVELQLVDAATNQSVDGWFQNIFPNQYFTVAAGQSEVVKFPIEIPFTFNSALKWRIIARAGNISDGEEAAIPVLTNKALVTETLPLPMRSSGTRQFSFDKLIKTNSESLQHHALTVEFTSNPAWYAVQALPYLMQQENEQVESIWNHYYANAMATKIVQAAPRIKQIFQNWKTLDTSVLLSNLQKNEELKSALLQETPWVLQAKSETEQKKNIAILFDLVRMSGELNESIRKLREMQSPNGGFVWIKGGPDDRYMTQYIVTGIGHLKHLGAVPQGQDDELDAIAEKALPYLDRKVKDEYDQLIKSKANLKIQPASPMQAQYLYMRSFFRQPIPKGSQTAYQYFRGQAQQHWTKTSLYNQGMIALALYRTSDTRTPAVILKSLKERAILNEELGIYWKENAFGYSWYWWQAPIETQALMIEAFGEIAKDQPMVDQLKTWLIKNKQTNNWRSTRATAEACYALLLQGADWISSEPVIEVKLGNTLIKNTTQKTDAGTGYFKKAIEPQFITPEMGKINVTVSKPANQSSTPTWGAVYWQYFEDLDKITSAATPLKLNKKLFIQKNSDQGPVLEPIVESSTVKVGDKIMVRIELRVDRDIEYVHMKDLHSSALEPVNVLSGYKWQGGLGYYESTKDVSTQFFFQYLRKGTYVFEYPLFVSHSGNFSNGITTIQSLYAPEFTSHSEGVRITVE